METLFGSLSNMKNCIGGASFVNACAKKRTLVLSEWSAPQTVVLSISLLESVQREARRRMVWVDPPVVPLPVASSSRAHPSWWRPDLVQSPAIKDNNLSAYRLKKAKWKRIIHQEDTTMWNRSKLDKTKTYVPPYQRRNHEHSEIITRSRAGSRSHREGEPRKSRDEKVNLPALVDRVPLHHSKERQRKRRFDDNFLQNNSQVITSKNRVVTVHQKSVLNSWDKEVGDSRFIVSDSQRTISDPRVEFSKARLAVYSPNHTRERPLRLNLQALSVQWSRDHVAGDVETATEKTPDSRNAAKVVSLY